MHSKEETCTFATVSSDLPSTSEQLWHYRVRPGILDSASVGLHWYIVAAISLLTLPLVLIETSHKVSTFTQGTSWVVCLVGNDCRSGLERLSLVSFDDVGKSSRLAPRSTLLSFPPLQTSLGSLLQGCRSVVQGLAGQQSADRLSKRLAHAVPTLMGGRL